MNVARVIRNRDHQARAKSGYFSGFTQNVCTHSAGRSSGTACG